MPNIQPHDLPGAIFRAYDIRGIVDQQLTEENIRAIGQVVGSLVLESGQDSLVVGRDGRDSGNRLLPALAAGINASGCDLLDLGRVPTPLVYFAAAHQGIKASIALTGSHNPKEYNGLKIMVGGRPLSGEGLQRARQRVLDGQLLHGQGRQSRQEIIASYISHVTQSIKVSRPFKLVIDCGNGIPGAVAPALYRAMGCQVEELYCEVDGNFPNHHPDPSQPENLLDLIARVKETQADLGLAFDGDGDRLTLITEDGTAIMPDRMLVLFAREILQRKPGAEILFDVKCSRVVGQEIERAGGVATMTSTGHSLIKNRMLDCGAELAGEMSGHIFFKDRWFGFDDALYAGARLLEILGKSDIPVSKIFAAMPDTVNTQELRIELTESEHQPVMAKIQAAVDFPNASISTIDGIRVDFSNGFALIRPSNTTPMLILRFEGDDQPALNEIQGAFRHMLASAAPELKLPF